MNAFRSFLTATATATIASLGLALCGVISIPALMATALAWTLLISVKAYSPRRALRLPVGAGARASLPLAA
jgi:hypothetical protein